MFEADEMEGCHSCKYGDEFDTEKEPCKYCYGLSLYTKKENNQCPWYDMCIYKTATCRVRYPDNGCVLYRWFKELISKGDKE